MGLKGLGGSQHFVSWSLWQLMKNKKKKTVSSCYNRRGQPKMAEQLTGQYCNIIFSKEAMLENRSDFRVSPHQLWLSELKQSLWRRATSTHAAVWLSWHTEELNGQEMGSFCTFPSHIFLSLLEKWPLVEYILTDAISMAHLSKHQFFPIVLSSFPDTLPSN